MPQARLRIEGRTFRDEHNREVTLRGINVAGDAKLPAKPDINSHTREGFFDGDDVSFVGRPFALEEANDHFSRLRRWGYNTIRYVFTWEAIEHAGPGKYDEEWIDFTLKVLRIAKDYGFYIFMDPHQDVWSRFTGGSGAPMWTIYAIGLDPERLAVSEAAWVQNTYSDLGSYPKMIWATNYQRFACQTIFTLFFAGRDFAPKAIIDGKNIQDYLQDHFIAAIKHFAKRIHDAGDLENDVVIGWESVNEPNRGWVGWQDLTAIPPEQKLRKGPSPTSWQAILTANGRACEEETFDFGGLGPFKSGSILIDPKGETVWLSQEYDDTKYGWKRDPEWRLGECLWAQHGVWDPSTDEILRKDYFAKHPRTGETIDYEYFTNRWWMEYYHKHRDALRSIHTDAIMFFQPPVLEIPPSIKGTPDDDPNMVFSPHFYDGITLITKKWNRYWNIDVFGLLRGKYLAPPFAVKIGESAIRNCFRDQLSAIRKEGVEYMGNHPCIFTEIGIPYDMDEQHAYKTGDYSSQSAAIDANHFALEGCGVNGYTWWLYAANNVHKWGDQWNGEDLSIYSLDDRALPLHPDPIDKKAHESTFSLNRASPSYSQSQSSDSNTPVSQKDLKTVMSTQSISSQKSDAPSEIADTPGFRAAEAYVRPSPLSTCGNNISSGFDLRNAIFTFDLESLKGTTEEIATEIFLPEFHFPRERTQVEGSSGKWTISVDDEQGADVQRLRWWHEAGKQSLKVTGVRRRQGMGLGKEEEEEGYWQQCRNSGCTIM